MESANRRLTTPDEAVAQWLSADLWEIFPGHLAVLDRAGIVLAVNRAWREFGSSVGAPATAQGGVNYLEWCHRHAAEGDRSADDLADLVAWALSGASPSQSAARLLYPVQRGAKGYWLRVQVLPLPGPGGGALVMQDDVTPEKELEDDLRHRAFHDPLTGLPNRALLLDRLEHAVARASRDGKSLAVLFADLDAFKTVNDRFGHLVGDRVLCQAAHRLADCVRVSDTVGRWGGDEFVVVAERLDNTFTAGVLADRIAESFRVPMCVDGLELRIRASIGVAQLDNQPSATHLVEEADRALLANRELMRRVTART